MSRVLLVHADAPTGAKIAAALTEVGLDTRVVTSGEHAMDRFIQEPADVLLIDYHLEGRDGVSTAEAIRWMPGGRRARLVLTADHDLDEGSLQELGQAVDAFASLVGPVDMNRLRAMVQRAAALEPQEAATRILSTDKALLQAERLRAQSRWDESTAPTAEVPFSDIAIAFEQGALGDEEQTLDEPAPAAWELEDPSGAAEGREVIALAASEKNAHSELFGTFDRLGFARVLAMLAEKRAGGALICVHPPDERATTEGTEPTKVVYFRGGVPVHVRSNLVDECLGQVLVRQRKIGRATLGESLRAVDRGEGRQGEVLVAMGALTPLDLSEALAEQLRTKLLELFSWRRGSFRFAAGRPPPPELIDLEMGLAEIAYHGVRESTSPPRALDALSADLDRFVVPSARAMVRFVSLGLPDHLRAVVRGIDGSRTLREALQGAPEPGEAAQLIQAMLDLEAVSFEERALRRAAVAPAAAGLAEGSGGPRRPGSARAADLAPDVRAPRKDAAPSSGAGPRLAPTRVSPGAAGETAAANVPSVGAATTDAGRTRAIARDAVDANNSLPSMPEAAVMADSSSVLAHNSVSEGWAPSSSEWNGEAPAVRPAFGEVDDPVTLDHEPPAAVLRALAVARAAPKPTPTPPEEASPSAEVRRERETDRPPRKVAPDPTPAPRQPSPAEPRSSAEVLDDRVERLLRAERHARRAQRELDRARPDKAKAAMEKALELCPGEPKFVVLSAWARQQSWPNDPVVVAAALVDVESACARAPTLTIGHIVRARLLEAAGRDAEARAAWQRAHELDPDDREASARVRG